MMIRFILIGLVGLLAREASADSLALYPRDSETREALTLNGVWNFRLTNYSLPENFGFTNQWYTKQLDQIDDLYERMPVPSSYNDITESRDIRDFSGWVWYDRTFFVPRRLQDSELLLRFGSVNYAAVVYLNGQHVVNHTGGHLPFQVDVTKHVKLGAENHISVAVSNILSGTTVPQGKRQHTQDSRMKNTYFYLTEVGFDFFNYAGIQRSVIMYAVPKMRINDLTVTTTIAQIADGIINYNVTTNLPDLNGYALEVTVNDKKGKTVANQKGPFQGSVTVKNAQLWWPFTMNDEPGYLYRVAFSLYKGNELVDRFYQMVGIRTIEVSPQHFLINGKPFYFRGFGKHEEYNVRGRALDQVMIAKDFSLIKWLGANSFRTSHYPYSEELMDEADAQGIVVIDETPAVGLSFGKPNETEKQNKLLHQHLQYVREMTERDKNRASVVMWSVANEPDSSNIVSKAYFEKVIAETRSREKTRPVTAAISHDYKSCHLSGQLDLIMVNRYFGWYQHNGYPEQIQGEIEKDIQNFYNKYKRPIMISEYGADTIAGMHTEPSKAFSEDYQVELINEFHKGFDALRAKLPFVGEHIWNFADFATSQGTTRVGGNKKGILTREREPKSSARVLRCRYWQLAHVSHNLYQKGVSYCPQVVY